LRLNKDTAHPAAPLADAEKDPTWRYRLGLIVLGAVFVVVFFASFYLGRYPTAPAQLIPVLYNGAMESLFAMTNNAVEFLSGLFGQNWQGPGGWVWPDSIDRSSATVILQVRLPRVVCGVFVGAALSLAGASYQGLFQNPMVSQDILGASSGAAFGAALAILLGLGSIGITSLAFCAGLLAVALAYGISKASRLSSILAMILAGMVVSALFSAATSFIKLVADTEDALPAITYWLMGSLNSVRQGDMLFAIPLIALAGIPLLLLRWRINLLATGEEEARSMGVDVRTMRLAIIACATLLTATCVSISGLIGWVGLIIPHFCRLMFGYDYRRLMVASLFLGATFLVAVDNIARLAATSEIPIGILTAVAGAPLFIFLMMKGGLRYGR
jgi:iron complex transport system permease protein